jgi:hypothetical protein
MTTKSFRLIPQIMAAVFTLFGMAACSTTTASAPDTSTQVSEPATTFKCVKQGSGWITIAKGGNVTISPMIVWNTIEFGPGYEPEERCKQVSERLTKAVADNGGKLGFLQLRTGVVNNRNVVCFVNDGQTSCDDKNMLFTLNQKNSQKPEEVLKKILNISEANATGNQIEENGNSASILLENLVQPADSQPAKKPKI